MQFIPIIILTSISVYALILLFLIVGFLRNTPGSSSIQSTVSIIVAARNEEQNIGNCLSALIAQSYPEEKTEIIIIDDRSTDRTGKIVESFRQNHQNIRLITIDDDIISPSPKKRALSMGIAQSSGEIIVTTDADCAPPPEWIARIISAFESNTGMLIGPAPLEGHNILTRLISLDSYASAFISAGSIGWNIGITCTGRNQAYRRTAYDEVRGFDKIAHSLSGDDDLLLQTVSRNTNWKLKFLTDPKAAVFSPTVKNFTAYIRQHLRHVSASKYYSFPAQFSFLLYNLANTALFILPISAILTGKLIQMAIGAFLIKLVLDFISLSLVVVRMKKIGLLLLFPFWELWYLLNQLLLNPLGIILKPRWK